MFDFFRNDSYQLRYQDAVFVVFPLWQGYVIWSNMPISQGVLSLSGVAFLAVSTVSFRQF